MYLYVRTYTRDRNSMLTKKQKQHPSPGDDASTAEAASGRVGRDRVRHDEQTAHGMVVIISS